MSATRDVSGILKKVREIFLGRKNVNFLRFQEGISARTQPPPNLPEGSNQKLAENYYYSRDARRIVKPDNLLYHANTVPRLTEGTEAKESHTVGRTPGRVHMWDA
ncbi:hypothetical protein RUM43_010362 [Polyplax serrata]|uniref:NADH dehydrogenase [ubiquinone] 1 alpha subcomplex subunit 7 n=1 Tax=Polyplax serrata TaxID=468196 RepID=A0AAN8S9Z1_POLSC